MATAILDKLLQTQFGKSLIFWFFLFMGGGIAALGWLSLHQANELKQCNADRAADNRQNDIEKAALARERILDLQQIIHRLEAVEKKRKR